MWNYIKGLIRNGSLLAKFLLGAVIFVAIMTLFALSGSAEKNAASFLAISGFSFYKR